MNTAESSIGRRSPEQIMRLSRLGSLHQCRLSFMRTLTRRMARENWQFTRANFEVDDAGVGTAVYTATGPEHSYSLVAFAHDLPAEKRSDRVIAEAWDATFTLFDGVPDADDLQRLYKNVPYQEAGRISDTELTLSRANRSVRLWNFVVDALASGQQPTLADIDQVGYLMRTTAVYGSGKFGAAARESIEDRPELQVPFQAELLSVYLIRTFVRDLVQHMASVKGGDKAVRLAPEIAQRLGIGNSTGLGMAPFIVNHPILFNNWIMAREEAIVRVRGLETASGEEWHLFNAVLQSSQLSVDRWHSDHPLQREKLAQLRRDLKSLYQYLDRNKLLSDKPWDRLIRWSESALSEEGQEFLASLIMEPYPDLVDGLSGCMADSNRQASVIDGSMSIGVARSLLERSFGWALSIDWTLRENCARLWYVSAEKLEPRLGERFDEPIEPYEEPLAPARDAALAYQTMATWDDNKRVAELLLQHPEHRHTLRRAQMWQVAPYGEIRDNTISETVLPIDMLRAKLSFFGAIHFDPRSDRWVRICMYAGAPYPEDLNSDNSDFWIYPGLGASAT